MAEPGEKNISAYIDPQISEEFKVRCEGTGSYKRKHIEGAIRLWLSLPNEVQSILISNPEIDTHQLFAALGKSLRIFLHKALTHEEQFARKPSVRHPKDR